MKSVVKRAGKPDIDATCPRCRQITLKVHHKSDRVHTDIETVTSQVPLNHMGKTIMHSQYRGMYVSIYLASVLHNFLTSLA